MFRGKNYKESAKLIDKQAQYEPQEAFELITKTAKAKFDETVELHVKLGVDSRHADQQVRGAIVLPHGTGKVNRVLVFCKEEQVQEALDAGADYAGGQDLVAKIQGENWFEFDTVIASPNMMGVVGRLGKVLGPKGLMPSPKAGTVTPNIANAIKETSEGYDVPVVGLAMDPACQTKSEGVPYKNMFALQPSATTQGDIMAAFAVKNGYKTFGILYNQENAYSVSLLAPFVDRLAEDNITVDNSMIVAYGAADTDYKTLLLPLVNANVDAIYCPNYTQQLVAIETAATELGYKGKIITGLDGAPGFNTTYGGDCSNIYYINNINTEDETIAAKIAEIQNDVSAPNKYFLGYDIVMAAADCIAKVGTDYTALHDALENLSYEGVTGKITIDPTTHMPTGMSMYMYTYDNQTPVMLEQFAG